MPVLRALWRLIKRDYFTVNVVVLKSQCGDLCSIAAGIAQETGFKPALCNASGNFGSAMLDVYACSNTGGARITVTESLSTVSELQPVLSYCQSSSFLQALEDLSSSQVMLTSSMCSSYYAVGSTPTVAVACPAGGSGAVVLLGGNITTVFTTATTGVNPVTSTPIRTTPGSASSPIIETLSSSTFVAASDTLASTSAIISSSPISTAASDDGPSKEAIAGIAVGGTAATFLLIATVIYSAWWFRRKHRKGGSTGTGKKHLQGKDVPEKAQLHSDDFKPRRVELEGSKPPLHVRKIEGLHEVQYQDLTSVRLEMDVNEVVATELDKSGSDRIGTDSTFVDFGTPTGCGQQS